MLPSRLRVPSSRRIGLLDRSHSPRRATALHPHLDDYPEFYSDGTLSSGSGYTWEDESGEEEAREQDEVEQRERIGRYVPRSSRRRQDQEREEVRIGAYINPPGSEKDTSTQRDDYSLGFDQADSVVENLASSGARPRARGYQPQRRDNPPHPPLTVHGHVVIDDGVNPEGLHRVLLHDRARMDRLGIPRGSAGLAPKSKAMPAIAKPMT
eukprot:681998-Amphidinium_carterae.1